jgi:hypothetical protein
VEFSVEGPTCNNGHPQLSATFSALSGSSCPKARWIELGHQRALELVALVEEGEPEGEADVREDSGVLGLITVERLS